ncbi:hypothetical protein JCM10908_002067 [Rhodotorula pacifica]|uniref:uncharacterized protein n=1 Tax=Rhodotorula pacifica TaxID=1495444 RepID=UPI00317C555B
MLTSRRAPAAPLLGGPATQSIPVPHAPLRLRMHHLVGTLVAISLGLFYFTSQSGEVSPTTKSTPVPASPAASVDLNKVLEYCPWSTERKHIPTVALVGDQLREPTENRTFFVADAVDEALPASFLPYTYPPRELRFAQTLSGKEEKRPAGQGRLHEGVSEDKGEQLCRAHRVPSSPRPQIPGTAEWKNSKVMFGMSTVPDRVLWNLPVWSHWLPKSPQPPLDTRDKAVMDELPLVFILMPEPNPTEEARSREAVDEANSLGMHVKMRAREADRFETRYFALVEEMWIEAKVREAKEGVKTEWFILADDDTFYPDFDSLARLLASHNPEEDLLIGTLSESTKQVAQWGHIAYGGAGIILSRSVVEKMNASGFWRKCLHKYGSAFGGDAMVTHCAADAMEREVKEALTLEETMHQLDIRGDGTGFFQSGFLFTSIHHWGSWFTLFPPWHESGEGDLRNGVTLVGKAAKAVGGDNWGRRYIFDAGRVVVALGYTVTIEAKPVTEDDLAKSEHTWWEFETFHPIRPSQEEAKDKRTYYITGVRQLDAAGIYRLEHKNREGERIDILWDQRDPRRAAPWWSPWRQKAPEAALSANGVRELTDVGAVG